MLRRPPRLRLTRFTLLTSLLSLSAFYYIFLSAPSALPVELLDSPIYHSPLNTSTSHAYEVGQEGNLGLAYGDDGLVRGWDTAHELIKRGVGLPKREKKRVREIRDRHPILELMDKGEKRWKALIEGQSKTLPQAVTEYTRRYSRPPPKGFEVWWQFCKKHGVKIVDDYDQIFRDIEPYFALSPKEVQKRVLALDKQDHSYQISLSPTSPPTLTGPRSSSARGRLLFTLLSPLSPLFPSNLKITVSDHDTGNWYLGADYLEAARKAVRDGRYLSEGEWGRLERKEGWSKGMGMLGACARGEAGWEVGKKGGVGEGGEVGGVGEVGTTFIHDPYPTYSACTNPSLLSSHGSHSFPFQRESRLRPLFQLSKYSRDPSLLTTPLEAYENHTSSSAAEKYTPWSEKSINKLFWRGSSTGDHYSHRKGYDWRESHRTRLHFIAQGKEGDQGVWVERGKEWVWEKWGKGRLNGVWMDVGLSGKPHQCSQDDGTCDEMAKEIIFADRVRPEDAVKYKYALDVDGNGWSSRFHRLLMSGSMVIKATIYQEWQSDWMIPWYHYVPTQVDYSDLYSILSFFIGPPDGRTGGHDELAEKIAKQGREFGEGFWRWEDMQAYMFRLLLEYSRLMADDREEASYQKTYT